MTAAGWSEAPMDLDSPFVKTALVQEKTGQVIERTVKKGKLNGTLLELEKGEGGLLILPKDQILAILPRLPKPGMAYLQIDADKALQVLLQAQREFPQRPEVQESVLREWRTLGAITTEHDKMQSAALDEWLQKCGRLSSEIQPEELEKISEEGIGFLQKFPGRAKEIELELKGLRELGGIDLKKADSVRFELGGLSDNILVGVAFWALLLVPLGVALKGLSDGIRGVREKSVGAGLLRILVGAAALAFYGPF